jgi:peptide/nickel transport system ATP-binding protein
MYAGRIVEIGPVGDVIHRPRHPYTAGLMGSIPSLRARRDRLVQIEGAMPRLTALPSGCAFHTRCMRARPNCASLVPQLARLGASDVACHWPLEGGVAA